MLITEISIQKRNQKRSNVYVDGNYYCALDNFTVVKNNLKPNTEIDEETFSQIQFESECDKALNYAFGYLSKYRKTEKELANKLVEKGYLPQIVEYVMTKTKDYNFVNDVDYANSYVDFNKHKKGVRLLKMELKNKGVEESILNDLQVDKDEEKKYLNALVEKFFKNKEVTRENIQKLYRFLLSKGFDYDGAKTALAQFKDNLEFGEEFEDNDDID
ncbi:MAG: RecX family transcriptional regulator [Clostridia bacterium]